MPGSNVEFGFVFAFCPTRAKPCGTVQIRACLAATGGDRSHQEPARYDEAVDDSQSQRAGAVPLPFELRYELTRTQRLRPLLRLWRLWGPVAVTWVGAASFGLVTTQSYWMLLPLLVGLWLFRGLFADLLNILRISRQPMDLIVESNGLGFVDGDERWWIFLDSLLSFDELASGIWTVRHSNGTIVHIPQALLTDDQVAFFRDCVAKAEAHRIELGIQGLSQFMAIFLRGNRLRDRGE